MTDQRAAILTLSSALILILGLLAYREVDSWLRELRIRRRAGRRKGWL